MARARHRRASRFPGRVGPSVSGGTTLALSGLLGSETFPGASRARTTYVWVAGAMTPSE